MSNPGKWYNLAKRLGAEQRHSDNIAQWTDLNKMKINEDKTRYMVFSRSETEVATRLAVNSRTIDRIEETKLVGVWLDTSLD